MSRTLVKYQHCFSWTSLFPSSQLQVLKSYYVAMLPKLIKVKDKHKMPTFFCRIVNKIIVKKYRKYYCHITFLILGETLENCYMRRGMLGPWKSNVFCFDNMSTFLNTCTFFGRSNRHIFAVIIYKWGRKVCW